MNIVVFVIFVILSVVVYVLIRIPFKIYFEIFKKVEIPLEVRIVLVVISIFGGLMLYEILSRVSLFGVDVHKEKLKRERKKHRYVKVKHHRYIEKARATRYEYIYIGYDRLNDRGVYLSVEDRTRHVHILGSTGAGKSVLLFNIFRQDVESGRAVIFIDAKGDIENLERVREIVSLAGREKDLLVFRLDRESNTYNPLYLGNATQLKDKIISSIRWSEVYYQRVSENMLLLLFNSLDKTITMKNLYEIIDEPDRIYGYSSKEVSREYIEFANSHKKEKTTLLAEISLIVNSDFSRNFDEVESEINFLDVVMNNKIVYFGIDVQSYQETSRRVGRMITEDINTLSGIIQTQIREVDRRYVSIIIDEFGAFGTENFINSLSRGRSSKFMITIAHQSLADLEMIKERYSQQVIDNTYTKIVLQLQDPFTIQAVADMIGTYKEFEHTKEVRYDIGVVDSGRGTVKIVDEYIIHPNDIRRLRIGEAVYKSGNAYGIVQIPHKLA